ncbi:MAG: oligosaccharide flippase family protein [bacterium]
MIEKLKELTKDTAIYGISTIVGRFINFLLVPFYTNFIIPSEFGIYAYVYACIAFLNIAYIYGMDAAFMKYISLAKEEEKKDLFSTPFIFVTATSFLLSVSFYLFRTPLSSVLKITGQYEYIIYYVILILMFDTLALIPFADLRLQRKAKRFAVIKILNILINLSLNLILIIKFQFGIEAIFISNLAASVVTFIILLPDIFLKLKFKINKAILIKMLRFGFPYLPASISATIVQVIDRPILRALTDNATLGIYQANYKLGIFMMLFVSMFQYAWQPFFLTNAKEKNAKEIFAKVLTLFVIAGSLVWVVISLFISDLAAIEIVHGKSIIGHSYLSGIVIVPIVLLGYLFNGMYVNFTAGLYIEEKTKYFPLIAGAGAAVNVIANFTLIPIYGIMGAAFATLLSYMVMAVYLYFVTQKFYKINYEMDKIGIIIILITIVTAIYYYLFYANMLNMTYKVALLIGFIVALFGFGIIKPREIRVTMDIILRRR